MRSIPPPMRQALAELPRMKVCVLADLQGIYGECAGQIEWEHVWIYAGKQINEIWAIIGACKGHHAMKDGDRAIKGAFETASLLLATASDLEKYPRKPWGQIQKSLGLH